MSTSLSRQLEQIRRSSQVSATQTKDGTTSSASKGPNILNIPIGHEELVMLSEEALQELSIVCPVLRSYHALLFEGEGLDEGDVDMEEAKSVEDVLFLLTPFVPRPAAQYLLQYLISKHKVHLSYGITLLFAVIPYYETTIFHRVVEAIPTRFAKTTAEEEFPRWMENFKSACHPATTVGLTRHLASDQGFFKLVCHVLLHKILRGHINRFAHEEGVSYDNLLYFFTVMLTQGLNLCGSIGEHHTYNLLQVIISGLKNDVHKEYRSSAVILFGSVVPRVTFNGKVCKKITKSLNKFDKKDIESLSMLVLLFRTQIERVDKHAILAGYVGHKKVLMEQVFANFSKQTDEDQEFARRVLKSMALLASKLLPSKATKDISELLSILERALADCVPSRESAEILISSMSKALLEFKAGKKKDDKKCEILRACIASCKKILDALRASFVEEYSRLSALKNKKDILFIDGVDNPTAEMVLAKTILTENDDIVSMTKQLASSGQSIKAHISSIKTVLSMESGFLLSQMSSDQVACLCVNVLRLLPGKFSVAKLAVRQLNFLKEDEKANQFLNKNSIVLAMLVLNVMFNPAEKKREDVGYLVEEFGKYHKESFIAKLVPTWVQSEKDKKLTKLIYAKLASVINVAEVLQLNKMMLEGVNDEAMLTLAILLTTDCLKSCTVEEQKDLVSLQLVKISLLASKHFGVSSKPEKENSDPHKQVLHAIQSKAIPLSALKSAASQLLAMKNQAMLIATLAALWQKQSVDPSLLKTLLDGMKSLEDFPQLCGRVLVLPVEKLSLQVEEGQDVLKHMRLQALKMLQEAFADNVDMVKKAMTFGSDLIPSLLSGLFSPGSKKVRKNICKCFEVILTKPVSRANYAPLVKCVVAHKATVIASPENMTSVIQGFKEDTRSCSSTFEALLDASINDEQLLFALCPVFNFAEVKVLAQLSLHCTQLLASFHTEESKKKALESVLDQNGTALVSNLDEAPVWELVTSGIKLQDTSCLFMNVVIRAIENQVAISLASRALIYQVLIDMSGDENVQPEVLATARVLLSAVTSCDMTMAELKKIWGDQIEAAKKTPLKKRPVVAIMDDQEPVKWKKTVFLLEVAMGSLLDAAFLKPLSMLLAKALESQADHTYAIDLIISALLAIVDGLSPEEKEANHLDSELVVRCVRNCMNPDTKASALMLLAKSTASTNAEYILHNSIQLFTFVGSHFLQMESKSSFDIACTAIDVLVPHILSACQAKGGQDQVREMSINILNTFVDASSDMPRHRFCTFMHQLVQRLGASDYLWLLTLLLIKADLRKKHYDAMTGSQKSSKLTLEERLQQLLDLYETFEEEQMETLVISVRQMVKYTSQNSAAARKLLGITAGLAPAKLTPEEHFDMIRIKMLSFAQHLMASKSFIEHFVGALNSPKFNQELKNLLEVIVGSMDDLKSLEDDDELSDKEAKIRKHLTNCYEKVFETVLSLLPCHIFTKLLRRLLEPSQPQNIQRKALEVLTARFAQNDDSTDNLLHDKYLPKVLKALSHLAVTGGSQVNQQLALLCVKSLARIISNEPNENLLPPLKDLSASLTQKAFLQSLEQESVVAAALLCIAEVLSCLGPQGVVFLQPFVKWLLQLMQKERLKSLIVLNSLVVSLQKVFDSFAGFLHPHFAKLAVSSCQLTAWFQEQESDKGLEHRHGLHRIKQLHVALSKGIPHHNLLSVALECYNELKQDDRAAVAFSFILRENLALVTKSDVLASSSKAMEFFLQTFRYRQDCTTGGRPHEVEEAYGEAFLAFGLKVSLDDFKPLFYKLLNLALDVGNSAAISTVFHITSMVADRLKSLFGFASEMVVQKATSTLQEAARNKTQADSVMIGYVLDALSSIFSFNRVDALLTKSYEDHVNSILEFLDGSVEDEEFLRKVKVCLGQLAATTDDETQWKYLNYQVLMLIRSKSPTIRLTVLDIVDVFVDKRGESYLATLPDAVNFLVEALEDEEHHVENRCRALIKKMEDVFGQSIQSYFE